MDNTSIKFIVIDKKPFPFKQKEIKNKLLELIKLEGKILEVAFFYFCSDDFLLELNQKFLQHEDYTDILSFQYQKEPIQGDIYISIDRAKDNAKKYKVKSRQEMLRLMIHGLLHFCGYKDNTKRQKELMRRKEDYYLKLFTE